MSLAETEARKLAVLALTAEGLSRKAVAKRLGLPRGTVCTIVWRARGGKTYQTRVPRSGAVHKFLKVEPSKTPFAPDDSCPDFAWDEEHIAAVRALRPSGFPVAFLQRARAS